MARDKIKCPGCDCKVSLSDIEKNDGACPECGQQVFVARQSQLFTDYGSRNPGAYDDSDDEMDDNNIDLEDENGDYLYADDDDDYEDDDDRELLGDDLDDEDDE